MKAGLTIAILTLIFTLSQSLGDETEDRGSVVMDTVSDMLEWQFGMTFALAERLENTTDGKDAVNAYTFRYFLLCHGPQAIIPPIPGVDGALTHQRKHRLADNQIKADPIDFGRVITPEKIEQFRKSGGRSYSISSIEDYDEIVAAFHLWLRSLGETGTEQGGGGQAAARSESK